MKVIDTAIPEVKIIEPKVFGDSRGFFMESFNQQAFEQAIGHTNNKPINFVQDNHSKSKFGVLRGLHYQIKQPQGKLVRVTQGEVYDVAVDLRANSPTFGEWVGCLLSADNFRQFWVPEGFAHGFLVLSETAEFLYKTTDYYAPEYERSIRWNDPTLAIEWPLGILQEQSRQLVASAARQPLLSDKDANACNFADAEYFMGSESVE